MTGHRTNGHPVAGVAQAPEAPSAGAVSSENHLTNESVSVSDPPNGTSMDGSPDVQGRTIRGQLLRPRTALSFLLALTILAVFVTRSDLDVSEIWANIRNADLSILAAAFFIYYFTLFLRAMRWRWMLEIAGIGTAQGTRLPGRLYLTGVYMVSWLVNCVVPAKLGDAYRAYRVKQDNGVGYSVGFGTIIAERVFDLAVLVTLLLTSGLLAFQGSLPGQAGPAMYLGIGMAVLVAAGLAVMYFGRPYIETLLPNRFKSHYTIFQDTLFQIVRRPVVPAVFAITVWLCEGARVYLVSESLGASVTMELALFVALLSALLTTLPFTPAGLGVVEVAIVTALTFVDIPPGMAGSVAVLDRMVTYWSAIVVGAIVAAIMLRHKTSIQDQVARPKEPVRSTSS